MAQARSQETSSLVLPVHYADPERSGLAFTVEAGPQIHDFHLGIQGPLSKRPRGTSPERKIGLRVGDLAPDVEGEDFDGRPFSLRDYRGQVVVVTFWGHW